MSKKHRQFRAVSQVLKNEWFSLCSNTSEYPASVFSAELAGCQGCFTTPTGPSVTLRGLPCSPPGLSSGAVWVLAAASPRQGSSRDHGAAGAGWPHAALCSEADGVVVGSRASFYKPYAGSRGVCGLRRMAYTGP